MSGLVPNPSVLLPLVVIDGTNELVTSTPIVTDFVGVEEVEVVPMINKSSSNHGVKLKQSILQDLVMDSEINEISVYS